jgi:hypothetical protein
MVNAEDMRTVVRVGLDTMPPVRKHILLALYNKPRPINSVDPILSYDILVKHAEDLKELGMATHSKDGSVYEWDLTPETRAKLDEIKDFLPQS